MTDSYFSFDESVDPATGEERHIYRLANVVIPGATSVLKDLKLTPPFPPGPYRVRGKRAHKACEYADLNTLHLYEIGEGLMGYVRAWQSVCREFGWVWEPDEIEQRVFDPVKLVAGTIDRVRRRDKKLVVDIKTGAAGREAALQTAAYVDMEFPDCQMEVERCSVEIHGDGTFSPPVWYRDFQDFLAWRGAVALWQWQNRKR